MHQTFKAALRFAVTFLGSVFVLLVSVLVVILFPLLRRWFATKFGPVDWPIDAITYIWTLLMLGVAFMVDAELCTTVVESWNTMRTTIRRNRLDRGRIEDFTLPH